MTRMRGKITTTRRTSGRREKSSFAIARRRSAWIWLGIWVVFFLLVGFWLEYLFEIGGKKQRQVGLGDSSRVGSAQSGGWLASGERARGKGVELKFEFRLKLELEFEWELRELSLTDGPGSECEASRSIVIM